MRLRGPRPREAPLGRHRSSPARHTARDGSSLCTARVTGAICCLHAATDQRRRAEALRLEAALPALATTQPST
jgi:hypothetical protein